jgi:hypothetical protein
MTYRAVVFLLVALGLSNGVSAGPREAATPPGKPVSTETKPSDKPAEIKPAPLPPPVVFFVAKGEPNACGSGCEEWIAADGTFDQGAEQRLRALLKRLGSRRLPVFFHSPGGSIEAGLAIGRMMRAHGLTAGVGWTVPQGCDPQQAREAACDKLKRSGRDLAAQLDTIRTMCNSSCVYALVGAAVREVGAGIRLGIHSSSISFSLRRTDPLGHVTRVATHVSPEVMRAAMLTGYDQVAAYLREMGIGTGLLTAAREIRNDHLRFLTREELVAFGIDRREFVESPWWLLPQTSGTAVKMIEQKDAGGFRKTYLRLTCRGPATIRFQYLHELGADRTSLLVPLRVTAKNRNFPLPLGIAIAQSDDKPPVEVRNTDLPVSVIEDASFVIETPAANGAASADKRFATLAPLGPDASFAALLRQCHDSPAIADRNATASAAKPSPESRESSGRPDGGTKLLPQGTVSPAVSETGP